MIYEVLNYFPPLELLERMLRDPPAALESAAPNRIREPRLPPARAEKRSVMPEDRHG